MKNIRFLMALLNVRLGYWIPNFRSAKKGDYGKPEPIPNGNVNGRYLLSEIGGNMRERMKHLNLSDGGHIENLAVYELLRRKCKFIISVEAGDLQRLERYESIAFGIEMEYDLTDLISSRTTREFAAPRPFW